MSTLLIHPGSPKTATSTLQRVLADNGKQLALQGFDLILPRDIRGSVFLGKYLSAYRGKTTESIAEAASAFFSKWHKKSKVICSEETFCHDFMPSRSLGFGGIDRAERAAELLSFTGFQDVKVVLTIRPQFDMLISTYTHFVHRHRETRPFRDWLVAEVDLENMLWVPVVHAFRAQFGAENVHVISLSMTREVGMEGYLSAILRAFGVNETRMNLAVEKVHNPSPSSRAVDLCRAMNRELKSPRKSEMVNSFLVETFPVEEFGKFKPQWKLDDALAALYARDHAEALALSVGAEQGIIRSVAEPVLRR